MITGLLGDYCRSLKATELEERIDLLVYRPAAFVVARALANTKVTPNQVSLVSLFFGLIAGFCFWLGPSAYGHAALSFFVCNLLDCADGQLARLSGRGDRWGYLIDGAVDYCAGTAVFVGMAHGLAVEQRAPGHWFLINTVAGCCYAWQCAVLDRKRKEWLHVVYGSRRHPAEEADLYRQELATAPFAVKPLIILYLAYFAGFKRLASAEGTALGTGDAPRFRVANAPVLRMALANGPALQATWICIAAACGRPDYYVWMTLGLGNAWTLLTLTVERRLARGSDGRHALRATSTK